MDTWKAFREHFENNARRPLPTVDGDLGVDVELRAEVAASLARFQLGEAGEGRIAKDIDRFHSRTIDDDYRHALKLFVKEEGRHARILGGLVRDLGGSLLEKTWTESLFVFGRRLLGIRLKLLVLLAAEVVGVGFYRAIAERLDEGRVRRALLEICADEEAHLAFHREFFRREAPSGVMRASFVVAWALVGGAACAVVLVDHRRTIKALGLDVVVVGKRLASLLVDASSRGLAQPQPATQLAGRGA